MIRIAALCGSLRAVSSNLALLEAAASLAPVGAEIELFDDIRHLPAFNPDFDEDAPAVVSAFRTRLRRTQATLISSPEYAHGIPGALKNALDWLVGSGELMQRPIGLLNASAASIYAPAQLAEVLRTMDGRVIADACVTIELRGRSLAPAEIAENSQLAPTIEAALRALIDAVRERDQSSSS